MRNSICNEQCVLQNIHYNTPYTDNFSSKGIKYRYGLRCIFLKLEKLVILVYKGVL